MCALPTRFAPCILPFAALFRQRTWRAAVPLLGGAILAPGVRTVASVLRVLGRAHDRHFGTYHRVLSRAAWSPRAASRVLLGLLLAALAPPGGPLVFGIDDTLERRRGRRILATRVYRDPVRSSRTHTITVSALRWLSVMLLVPIPWARRVWALPVCTALAPGAPQPARGAASAARAAARCTSAGGRRPKTLTDWARQMLGQLARWLDALAPGRERIVVADASFATLDLLGALAPRLTCIARLRFDAALFAFPAARRPGAPGRPAVKGARLPTLAAVLTDPATAWTRLTMRPWYGEAARVIAVTSGAAVWYRQGGPATRHRAVAIRWVLIRDPAGRFPPQALLSTDLAQAPEAVVRYYLQRWQLEVTFEEARRHLGLETQRQWAPRAIARTTPVLLALVSLVTLCATQLVRPDGSLPVRQAAWYPKATPTFSDALGLVRAAWWRTLGIAWSRKPPDHAELPRSAIRHLIETLCYAA